MGVTFGRKYHQKLFRMIIKHIINYVIIIYLTTTQTHKWNFACWTPLYLPLCIALVLVSQWTSKLQLLIKPVYIIGNYCEQRQDKQRSRDFPWGEQTLPRPALTDCPVPYYDPPHSQNGKNNIIISQTVARQAKLKTQNNWGIFKTNQWQGL